MKIAATTNGNTLEDLIADEFEKSEFLLVVETDDLSFVAFRNEERNSDLGLKMSKKVIEMDCEALICGSIEKPAFEEVAMAQITRYYGAGLPVKDSLTLMEAYKLPLIRDYKGGDGKQQEHNQKTCECGHHDE